MNSSSHVIILLLERFVCSLSGKRHRGVTGDGENAVEQLRSVVDKAGSRTLTTALPRRMVHEKEQREFVRGSTGYQSSESFAGVGVCRYASYCCYSDEYIPASWNHCHPRTRIAPTRYFPSSLFTISTWNANDEIETTGRQGEGVGYVDKDNKQKTVEGEWALFRLKCVASSMKIPCWKEFLSVVNIRI
jgi:hypothetical protein